MTGLLALAIGCDYGLGVECRRQAGIWLNLNFTRLNPWIPSGILAVSMHGRPLTEWGDAASLIAASHDTRTSGAWHPSSGQPWPFGAGSGGSTLFVSSSPPVGSSFAYRVGYADRYWWCVSLSNPMVGSGQYVWNPVPPDPRFVLAPDLGVDGWLLRFSFRQALGDPDPYVRLAAVHGLLSFDPASPSAAGALLRLLDDADPHVRGWAMAIAENTKGEAARRLVPRLARFVDPAEPVTPEVQRDDALYALARLAIEAPEAVDLVVLQLVNPRFASATQEYLGGLSGAQADAYGKALMRHRHTLRVGGHSPEDVLRGLRLGLHPKSDAFDLALNRHYLEDLASGDLAVRQDGWKRLKGALGDSATLGPSDAAELMAAIQAWQARETDAGLKQDAAWELEVHADFFKPRQGWRVLETPPH